MKRIHVLLAGLLVSLVVSCHYEFAAAPKSNLSVNPALRGKWEKQGGSERTVVSVATSPDGYLFIHYRGEKDDGMSFRAYPLSRDLPALMQLELLDSSKNDVPKERFTLVKATVDGDKLTWRQIDPSKLGKVADGAALLEALRKAEAANKDVFGEVQVFGRTQEK